MKNNLNNFPPVYYINLKDHNKQEYMETNFKNYSINNYTRIEAIDGRKEDLSQIVYNKNELNASNVEIACALSHLKAIQAFLDSEYDEAIIMEDDCDISISDYWNFSWNEIYTRLPHDYDIIQMVIISNYGIYARIHKRLLDEYSAACYLIKRHYAEKLISLYKNKIYYFNKIKPRLTSEFMLFESGKTYSIPLFIYKQEAENDSSIQSNSDIKKVHKEVHDTTVNFWKNNTIPLDDIMNLNSFFGNHLNLISKNDGEYSKVKEENKILNEMFGSLKNTNFFDMREIKGEKMKIVVYAICKNEEKHIDKFCENIFEADEVVILDTGSTDNSVKLLKEKGAKVHIKTYEKFRFDTARNDCLNLTPEDSDFCVSIDMDEYIEKGWREKLEKAVKPETTQLFYNNNYKIDEKTNKVIKSLFVGKIHKRNSYKWVYPVHEVLDYTGIEKEITDTVTFSVNHHPILKEKNYLPLLEDMVLEYPDDSRPFFFLAREYYFLSQYEKAIDYFNKFLYMSYSDRYNYTGQAQFRANANLYLAKIAHAQNKNPLVFTLQAVAENTYMRESWYWLGQSWALVQNWKSAESALLNALQMKDETFSIEKEGEAWDNQNIIKMIEVCRKKHSLTVNEIEGWMSIDELSVLQTLSKDMESVVEIGSWKGRSTHSLLSSCKGTVYAVDHFKGSPNEPQHIEAMLDHDSIYNQFMKNVGSFPNLKVLRMSSEEACKNFNENVDMVFIDGEHTYEAVKKDIQLWKSKANKIICGHDYHLEGVKKAVDSEFNKVEVIDTIWIYRK